MWMGIGISAGHLIDVPLAIRHICVDMLTSERHLDGRTFAEVEADTDPWYSEGIVAEYQSDWWNHNRPLVPSDILELNDVETIRSHLETHREACKALHRPETAKSTRAERPPMSSGPRNPLTCSQCKQYRDLAIDAIHRLEATESLLLSMAADSQTRRNKAMRAASGFFTLYEAALTKEMHNEGVINRPSPSLPHHYEYKIHQQTLQ